MKIASIEPAAWVDGLYAPALEVQGGCVAIPSEPGWGVTANPDWLARCEHAVSSQ